MKAGALEVYDWWDHFILMWVVLAEQYYDNRYADLFYQGSWVRVPYTSTEKRSPLGHFYYEWVFDHPRPAP